MDKNISHVIIETCKKLGIPYISINPNYNEFYKDALRLGELYKQLQIIAGDLEEICERHQIDGLSQLLHDDIEKIVKVEHDLVKLAHKLKRENE